MADSDTSLDFFSDAGDPALADLSLQRVRGKEELSTPYEYELHLLSTEDQGLAAESIDALMAQPCRFTWGDGQTVSGVITQMWLEPTVDPTNVLYRAIMRPRLLQLHDTQRSRVYQAQTVVEILEAVLTEHAIPYQMAATGTYPSSEYVVQYAESDLAFVSRLMEHWGLFYWFEQQPDGEVLVIGDDNKAFTAHDDYATLEFRADLALGQGVGFIGPMRRGTTPQTASLTIADYNWRVPYQDDDGLMTERQIQLRVTQAVDEVTGNGSHQRYGDHFKDDAEGAWIAQIRGEEMMVDRVVCSAGVIAPGLVPGHRLETSGLPIAELDNEYVVRATTCELDTQADQTLVSQKVVLFPADAPYRAPRLTPKPRILGFMHAVIDGEVDSVAAPIDLHGRYCCLMPYDVVAQSGGRATRWIRMAQSSAGSGYGMHLPLHIGTEVLVTHLDGDPDRPVILGAVPNVDTMSPVVDANATQSRIKTRQNILFELEDDA